jgi:hypothetical protein
MSNTFFPPIGRMFGDWSDELVRGQKRPREDYAAEEDLPAMAVEEELSREDSCENGKENGFLRHKRTLEMLLCERDDTPECKSRLSREAFTRACMRSLRDNPQGFYVFVEDKRMAFDLDFGRSLLLCPEIFNVPPLVIRRLAEIGYGSLENALTIKSGEPHPNLALLSLLVMTADSEERQITLAQIVWDSFVLSNRSQMKREFLGLLPENMRSSVDPLRGRSMPPGVLEEVFQDSVPRVHATTQLRRPFG